MKLLQRESETKNESDIISSVAGRFSQYNLAMGGGGSGGGGGARAPRTQILKTPSLQRTLCEPVWPSGKALGW